MAPAKTIWGGKWTEEKLDAFEKYVKAYLTIMNKNKGKWGWKTIYFDGFAGSGSRSSAEEDQEFQSTASLFGEQDVTKDELGVYRGAAERVVRLEEDGTPSFDMFCFVEKDDSSREALRARLDNIPTAGSKKYFPGDANEVVCRFAGYLRENSSRKALVFLDPFGMQIDWSTIQALSINGVDLWILIPTGVIINRLLEKRVNLDKGLIHSKKLSSFFGMPDDEIFNFFYETTHTSTLFEEDVTEVTKTTDSIKKIADLYVKKLQGCFKYVTETPLVLYNNHNVPIFHLAFASMNSTATKIAQQIINQKR